MSQKSGRLKPEGTSKAPKKAKGRDVVLVHGVSEDGESLAVLRAREDRVEAGVVRAVRDGEPLEGEVVKLKPRPEMPLVCDVETVVPEGLVNAKGGGDGRTAHNGPAQVATPTYRDNWDRIWSRAKPKSSKPN